MRSLAHTSMSENSYALHSAAHTATVSNSDRSCLICRALRGSEIETNTSVSGITFFVCIRAPKDEKATQSQGLGAEGRLVAVVMLRVAGASLVGLQLIAGTTSP